MRVGTSAPERATAGHVQRNEGFNCERMSAQSVRLWVLSGVFPNGARDQETEAVREAPRQAAEEGSVKITKKVLSAASIRYHWEAHKEHCEDTAPCMIKIRGRMRRALEAAVRAERSARGGGR
jgi:hypothetical protein